jgi:hypothetical protein
MAKIWLVVHRDNRQTPRIRATLSHITAWVAKMASILVPADLDGEPALVSEE